MNARGWCLLACAVAAALFVMGATPAHAQILRADWVDAGQKVIEQERRCAVRLLVLDATGKPVHAAVHLTLLRPAFPLGVPAASMVLAPATAATQPASSQPLWRCLNAVALDRLTDWAQLQPQAKGAPNFDRVEAAIASATARGQLIRWGPVLHGDPGRLPNWLVGLRGDALRGRISEHLDSALDTAAGRVAQFDIDCDAIDHAFIDQQLGLGGLRSLFERARVAAPHAVLCVRFDDALDGDRLRLMIQRVISLRDAFINVDMIAVSGRFNATVVQLQLARALQWLHDLDVPVCVVNLELGGPSPEAAAINAETVLRTLYAEPVVRGIWFAGMRADELGDPNAALIDRDGKLTPVGDIVDKLFHGLWGFDATLSSDALGDAHARIPPGVYDVTAKLPDGSAAHSSFLVSGTDKERLMVVQGTK